ncbi:UV-damaged DNA-binding protein rad7 [Thecaphora frezii]
MSGVRGPTSALTEFLRERGITARNTNRFRRRDADQAEQQQQQQQTAPQAAQASTAASSAPSPSLRRPASGSASPATALRRRAAAGSSMRFDEDDDSDDDYSEADQAHSPANATATASAGSSSAGRGAKRGAPASTPARTTRSAAKKPKKDDGDDDGDADYQDPAGAFGLPEPGGSRSNFSYSTRAPGSIAYCGTCKAKFTVTQYTKVVPGSGALCHRCGAAYKGEGAAAADGDAYKPPVPKKRQPRRKNVNILDAGHKVVPSLQKWCIEIISRYIEDLEMLGYIGAQNLDAISKSISKNRSLNPRTLQLFLLPDITTLSLYDCSKLDSESLQTIPTFAPRLQKINLQLCGQLDNAAIDLWAQKLSELRMLELYGPYLVRKEAWHRFFQTVGARLESFKIRESPRFDLGCAQQMVQHCPNLRELGLAQIGPLDAAMLKPLECYTSLTYLDISDPGVSAPGIPPKSLEDAGVISLLKAVGGNLNHLDISKNLDLTDKVVLEGIAPHCKHLRTLRLVGLEKITSQAMVTLFKTMSRHMDEESGEMVGLVRLHLDRMLKLDDSVLPALLEHSGADLVELSLNSVDPLSGDGLSLLASSCPNLEKLDLGFCRSVDDAVLEAICQGCPKLKAVFVFGCNRVSDFARSDRVKIIGKERYAM